MDIDTAKQKILEAMARDVFESVELQPADQRSAPTFYDMTGWMVFYVARRDRRVSMVGPGEYAAINPANGQVRLGIWYGE